MTPLERLKVLVEELTSVYSGTSLGNALSRWKEWLGKDEITNKITVMSPVEGTALITQYRDGNEVVKGLEWYQCPKCGHVFKVRLGDNKCPKCGATAIPLFVGVAKPERVVQPYVGTRGGDALISSVAVNRGTYRLLECPVKKKRLDRGTATRGIKSSDPQRPIMSLRAVCFVDSVREGRESCPYYEQDGHFCTYNGGRIYFSFATPLSHTTVVPVRPSEELTKPFIVTIHSVGREDEIDSNVLLRDFKEVLSDPNLVEEVKFGEITVWELQLFYTVGPPTTSRYYRIPVLYPDIDLSSSLQYKIPGRKLVTKGLYVKLNFDALVRITEEINKVAPTRLNEFTVAHSLSHVLLNAVVNTAGVSEEEVSESIFFSKGRREAEIVIYDNAPGGVDGVGAAVRNFPDLIYRMFYSARECPRRCRSACRACLFSSSCTYANTRLSWIAAYRLMNWAKMGLLSKS